MKNSKTAAGNFFEDFKLGQEFRHPTPRTLTVSASPSPSPTQSASATPLASPAVQTNTFIGVALIAVGIGDHQRPTAVGGQRHRLDTTHRVPQRFVVEVDQRAEQTAEQIVREHAAILAIQHREAERPDGGERTRPPQLARAASEGAALAQPGAVGVVALHAMEGGIRDVDPSARVQCDRPADAEFPHSRQATVSLLFATTRRRRSAGWQRRHLESHPHDESSDEPQLAFERVQS